MEVALHAVAGILLELVTAEDIEPRWADDGVARHGPDVSDLLELLSAVHLLVADGHFDGQFLSRRVHYTVGWIADWVVVEGSCRVSDFGLGGFVPETL